MSAETPEEDEPAGTLSAPGAAADWRSYACHRLDEIQANVRANGRYAQIPEVRDFAAMMARVAPEAPVEVTIFAVIDAARAAARDAIADGEMRMRARAEIAELAKAIEALRAGMERQSEFGLGQPAIAALAQHLGVEPALARPVSPLWEITFTELRRLEKLREALASPGMSPTPLRRLANRIAPIFQSVTGRRPTVTRSGAEAPASGRWVDFLAASAALAGIPAQPSEVGNAARGVVQAIKSGVK